MPLETVTSKNFDTEVLQSTLPVVVLWGEAMDVNSNQVAYQMMVKVDPVLAKCVRIDIDQSPDLVMRFSVRDVPLVVLWIQGMAMEQDTTLSQKILDIINEGEIHYKH